MRKRRWKVWVCPECGIPEFKPWSECWHVCNDPAYCPQAFDPTEESEVKWIQMVAVDREALVKLAQETDRLNT